MIRFFFFLDEFELRLSSIILFFWPIGWLSVLLCCVVGLWICVCVLAFVFMFYWVCRSNSNVPRVRNLLIKHNNKVKHMVELPSFSLLEVEHWKFVQCISCFCHLGSFAYGIILTIVNLSSFLLSSTVFFLSSPAKNVYNQISGVIGPSEFDFSE